MSTLIETPDIKAVGKMAIAVMASQTRVGRILGEPGTGKTEASKYLAALTPEPIGARRIVRLCCRRGMTENALARRIALALDIEIGSASTDAVLDACEREAEGALLVIDEGNHLRWQHLERLRYLSDECGAGLILIGTDLLHRTFIDGRNAAYLAQLARRIGTRQVRMGRMPDAKTTAAYVLVPRFGPEAGTRDIATPFYRAAQGYWGESVELADGCQRVMEAGGLSVIAPDVIAAASRDLAERRRDLAGSAA